MINTSKIYKMRIVFAVQPDSPAHADITGFLRTMVMASGVAFARAKQNTKLPRIAYGPSVKRGQIALREYADIYLFTSVNIAWATKRLERVKPEGFTLLDVKRIPFSLAGVQQLASAVVYRIEGDFESFTPKQTLENYITGARMPLVRQAANGISLTVDIKPFVRGGCQLDKGSVSLTLQRVADSWLNPLDVIYAWLGWVSTAAAGSLTDERFKIIREGLYWEDSQKNLHLI